MKESLNLSQYLEFKNLIKYAVSPFLFFNGEITFLVDFLNWSFLNLNFFTIIIFVVRIARIFNFFQ
jgi:hypothetical protein